MKKHILLSLMLGLGIFFYSNSTKSQNFQIVASFGTAHNWAVPNAILYEIDYYYPYHQIVHINRERRGRNLFFNVLLERRGRFVEVFFNRNAVILDINHFINYPLVQHICTGHCGFHGNFYRNYRVACNHRGHGHGHVNHLGHNHIAYRSNRNYNSYAARSSAGNRQVYRSHPNNRGGHGHNKYKNDNRGNSREYNRGNNRSSHSRNEVVMNSRGRNSNISNRNGKGSSVKPRSNNAGSNNARYSSRSSSSSNSSRGSSSVAMVRNRPNK